MEAKLIKFAADQFEAKPIRSRFIIPYSCSVVAAHPVLRAMNSLLSAATKRLGGGSSSSDARSTSDMRGALTVPKPSLES